MALECVVLYGLRSLFAAYSLEELSVFATLQVGLSYYVNRMAWHGCSS